MKSAIVLALMATASLAACSSNDSTSDRADQSSGPAPTTASASSDATAAAYEGATIPEGTYRKEVTRADIEKAGLSPADFDYGNWPRGRNGIVTYRFQGDSWTQFGAFSESSLTPGSSGTLAYDDKGRLVLSEQCCGDTIIRRKVAGESLTLKVVGPEAALADPATKIMRDGTYAGPDRA